MALMRFAAVGETLVLQGISYRKPQTFVQIEYFDCSAWPDLHGSKFPRDWGDRCAVRRLDNGGAGLDRDLNLGESDHEVVASDSDSALLISLPNSLILLPNRKLARSETDLSWLQTVEETDRPSLRQRSDDQQLFKELRWDDAVWCPE